mgnify:CR=1 FL=1
MWVSQVPERTSPSRNRSAWPNWKRTVSVAARRRPGVALSPHNSSTRCASVEFVDAPLSSASAAVRKALRQRSRSNETAFRREGEPAGADGKFKVPSLRNVAVTFPYMHDGRFQTLRQAIEHYNTDVVANSPNLDPSMVGFVNGLGLTQQDISDLIAFLETLTDESYLNNPAYASPF